MLPMPTDVIDRVNKLSRRDLDAHETLMFADQDQLVIPDEFVNESDSDYELYHPVEEEDIDNDVSSNDEQVGDDAVMDPVEIPADALVEDDNGNALDGNDLNIDLNIPGVDAGILPEDNFHPDADIAGVDDNQDLLDQEIEDAVAGVADEQADLDQQMEYQYGPRSRRPCDYSHLHATLEHTVMTQYSMKKGIKLFGSDGVDAVLQELKQLHDRDVIQPVHAKALSSEDRQNALHYLMFLKQKQTGKIKGRGCADGRKQQACISKEDYSSPTVSIESVMLNCTMDDVVYMKMQGTMADLLIRSLQRLCGDGGQ
jgi:hypothetical protein